MLSVFLEELSNQFRAGPVRDAVLENFSDEVTTPSHLSLFDQFAKSFDVTDAAISPATAHLVDSYCELLRQSPESSLAGLLAYESQGARIADTKAQGLIDHYHAGSEAVAFWSAHGSVEDDHAKWTLDALTLLQSDEHEVERASRLIAAAWWSFLDELELVAA
jgi:pyrroloquinoline quinone (PQQ) biosynthesis protein C